MKSRFTTTIDEQILKDMKIQAINEGTSVSELIERMFKEYQKNS